MDRPASLDAYRRKRDPERTPEPFGGGPAAGGSLFVVQKHDARRLHYDLRLEMDGVLKSWAVPKGPSGRAEAKRLAVHVEDHPLEYADFEGVIPPGNYGAGSVIVWDRGTYRSYKSEDLLEQYLRGKLELEFHGYKMRGRWTLVRMSRSDTNWLLLRKADGTSSDEELTERYPRSVISGLAVEEIGDLPGRRERIRAHLEDLGAGRREVRGRTQRMMLATPREKPFSGKEWLFEIKYDGVRVLAERHDDAVTLIGRNGRVVTSRYPEVARALQALPVPRFLIDGEIVVLDEGARPAFERLRARMGLRDAREIAAAMTAVPVVGVFFDCLALEGYDLRSLPLLRRKEILALLLPPLGPVRYSEHILERGQAFFEAVSEQRLEGMIGKRSASRYAAGRAGDWIKVKCQRRQEFVVGGYTDPRGSRAHFGALHLGVFAGGRLTYVSKVGTGFDQAGLTRIWEALQPLSRATSPFEVGSPSGRGHRWVEPTLVCEVRFTEWTGDGGIRHPTFVGMRDDKRPEDCRREDGPSVPPSVQRGPLAAPPARAFAGRVSRTLVGDEARVVRVTNAAKVFWPDDGYTKADLIAYYEAAAPLLLPYLKDRPLVLTRYPDGIDGKSFFQKDAPDFVPSWVRTERIYSKDAGREISYFIVNDVEMLRYVANLGTIPLHLWGSRLESLERPDWLVLDLDPKGAPFTDVVTVARELHAILTEMALPHYPKTSGGTGLHILVPLGAAYTYEQARAFARLIALLAVEAAPGLATLARPLRNRGGKVYVDYVQNGYGRTIVAPFALRPLRGAPVSCPLRWGEVTGRLNPSSYTLKTMARRFRHLRDPLAPVLSETMDMAGAVERVEARLHRIGPR